MGLSSEYHIQKAENAQLGPSLPEGPLPQEQGHFNEEVFLVGM